MQRENMSICQRFLISAISRPCSSPISSQMAFTPPSARQMPLRCRHFDDLLMRLIDLNESGSSDSDGGGSGAEESYQKKSKRSRTNSVASMASSVDVWRGGGQRSLQHAMAVIEDREQEMSHLFEQLHDIQADLSQMTDQVQ